MAYDDVVENKLYCPVCAKEVEIKKEDDQDMLQTQVVVECENCDTECAIIFGEVNI